MGAVDIPVEELGRGRMMVAGVGMVDPNANETPVGDVDVDVVA